MNAMRSRATCAGETRLRSDVSLVFCRAKRAWRPRMPPPSECEGGGARKGGEGAAAVLSAAEQPQASPQRNPFNAKRSATGSASLPHATQEPTSQTVRAKHASLCSVVNTRF